MGKLHAWRIGPVIGEAYGHCLFDRAVELGGLIWRVELGAEGRRQGALPACMVLPYTEVKGWVSYWYP